jgi:hypothetical protein
MIVLQDRLARAAGITLKSGTHASLEKGACAMELVSWVAGEPWSDHPVCTCPVIAAFVRSWNDSLPSDAERDRLLMPLIPQLVDSKSTKGIEERRSYLALDWMVRVFTPKFLDLVPALAPHAKALRYLEEIADIAGAVAAGKLTAAAWDAARAAARDAAGDAAGDAAVAAAWDAAVAAAWDAARTAARAAARAAAGAAAGDAAWAAAGDAAGAAAWDAAWDAAGDAAWDAAGDAAVAAAWDAARTAARAAAWGALKPTVEWLQISALDLVDRMLAVSPMVAMGRA